MSIVVGLLVRLGLPKIVAQLGSWIVLALAAYGVYSYWEYRVYQSGVNDTLTQIIEDNKKGEGVADRTITDVGQCFDRGGEWDIHENTCILP